MAIQCCIATVPFIVFNTFRLTRNHILQGMTVSNIQLLIGVYDSGKMLATFDQIQPLIMQSKGTDSTLTENTTETKKMLKIKIWFTRCYVPDQKAKQSKVLTYLTHDGHVHFGVLRFKRKNKHSIYFKTYFVSFRENETFRHAIFYRGWPWLTANICPTIQDMRIMFRVLERP